MENQNRIASAESEGFSQAFEIAKFCLQGLVFFIAIALFVIIGSVPAKAQTRNILTGPMVTVQTDGTRSDGQVNIGTQNAGPIQFFINNSRVAYFDSTTGNLVYSVANPFIGTSTSDGADNRYFIFSGGGGAGIDRSARLFLYGNEAASVPAAAYLQTGNIATADLTLGAADDIIFADLAGAASLLIDTATKKATFYNDIALSRTGSAKIDGSGISSGYLKIVGGSNGFNVRDTTDAADNLVIVDGGAVTIRSTFRSSATADLGWSIVNAANQACNTTCTSACVFGFNTGALGNLLACTDATADSCVCAGAS